VRFLKAHFDAMLRDEWIAKGKHDYEAGAWTDIKNEHHATLYEIGRLIGAELKNGGVQHRKGFVPGAEMVVMDDFVTYQGSDYHARQHEFRPPEPPRKAETEY